VNKYKFWKTHKPCCYPFFGSPHKRERKRENTKIKIKIVRIKQKKNQWEKDTKVPKNGLRLVEEDKNYKD
jgi:hypothetical protein